MMSEKDAGDDWNDAHVIRKVVSRQQAVPAELMTAAQRGATSSKPDTDLDLDDVAATSPKAKAELEALREQIERLEHELDHFKSQHTHDCIRCRYQYTPKEGESEDCPVCGCDGTL